MVPLPPPRRPSPSKVVKRNLRDGTRMIILPLLEHLATSEEEKTNYLKGSKENNKKPHLKQVRQTKN